MSEPYDYDEPETRADRQARTRAIWWADEDAREDSRRYLADLNAYEIEKANTPPTVEELDYQQTVAELRYLDQRRTRR